MSTESSTEKKQAPERSPHADMWLAPGDSKKLMWIAISFAVMLGIHFMPEISGLSANGKSVLGVFAWFMIATITKSFNGFVIGLASPLFIVMLTDLKVGQAFPAFNNDIFFLTIGAFVYAAVMMSTPLGKRIALVTTDLFRSAKITRLLAGLSTADVAISGFLPTVAETGLLLPIAKGFTGLTQGKEHLPEVRRINNGLMLLICGLMPLFTSLVILTAHFPNMLLAGFLGEMGMPITWMDWLILNLPLWLLIPVAFFYVVWYFKLKGLEIPGAEKELPKMKEDLGPISKSEIWMLISLGIALFLWITEKTLHNFSTGMVALFLIVLVFMPMGKLRFKDIMPNMMWDVWILLGGAVSLGTVLSNTGAVEWMVGLILTPVQAKLIGMPAILILIIVAFAMHIPRAGLVSAAATGAMFIPLTITMAPELGFNVLPFSLIITNCLSFAFFIPMSITAFFIAWGASDMSMGEVIKFGVPLSIICNIYVIVSLSIWLPLIGYPLMQ